MVYITVDENGLIFFVDNKVYRLRFDDGSLEKCNFRSGKEYIKICGVAGILSDLGPGYVIIITESIKVGELDSKEVYKVEDVLLVPLAYTKAVATLEKLGKYESIANDDDDDVTIDIDEGKVKTNVLLNKSPSIYQRSLPIGLNAPTVHIDDNKKTFNNGTIINRIVKFITNYLKVGFYYSSYDLTTSYYSDKTSRRSFIFNYKISQSLKQTPLYLPLLQGFIKSIDLDNSTKLVLISRRSTGRAGVRYLRRGVDNNGDCANWVETEQLLITENKVGSFVILRGSIPAYFQQSSFGLQPTPRLSRSKTASTNAFKRHFQRLEKHYNEQILCVNLAEMPPSREAAVGLLYSEIADEQNQPLEWFDFHRECRNMRFDLVEKLFNDTSVGSLIDKYEWTDKSHKQTGYLRVNCIDCLDRTNVVQTACARRILKKQLERGIDNLDTLFNALWADNGDAISKQYSGTNALKGDFTRTQKRGYYGIINDAILSLARTYQGMVPDFFVQACVDYFVGHGSAALIFNEFEQKSMNSDPMVLDEIEERKEEALNVCCALVTEDFEVLLGVYWCEVSKVLVITNKNVCLCDYDLKLEKVTEFKRIRNDEIEEVVVSEGTQMIVINNKFEVALEIEKFNEITDLLARNAKNAKTIPRPVKKPNNASWVGKQLKKTIWG